MGLGNWPVVRIENLIRAGVSGGFGYSLLGALEPATRPLTVRSPAPVQFMIVLIDAPAPQLLGQRFGDRESVSARANSCRFASMGNSLPFLSNPLPFAGTDIETPPDVASGAFKERQLMGLHLARARAGTVLPQPCHQSLQAA